MGSVLQRHLLFDNNTKWLPSLWKQHLCIKSCLIPSFSLHPSKLTKNLEIGFESFHFVDVDEHDHENEGEGEGEGEDEGENESEEVDED